MFSRFVVNIGSLGFGFFSPTNDRDSKKLESGAMMVVIGALGADGRMKFTGPGAAVFFRVDSGLPHFPGVSITDIGKIAKFEDSLCETHILHIADVPSGMTHVLFLSAQPGELKFWLRGGEPGLFARSRRVSDDTTRVVEVFDLKARDFVQSFDPDPATWLPQNVEILTGTR